MEKRKELKRKASLLSNSFWHFRLGNDNGFMMGN